MTAAERRSPKPCVEATREWIWRLWAIDAGRQLAAQARVSRWNLPHVSRELGPLLADGAVAAVLLTESVDALVARGIKEERLVAKLRRDPDVWPTWAEIRAAGLLARHTDKKFQLVLEPDRSKGAHFDLAFLEGDGKRHAIEFKAIGLSDAETAFCSAVSPLASALLPRGSGVLNMHVQDISIPVSLSRDERRLHRGRAEEMGKRLPAFHVPFSASTIVGHRTEATYLRRLSGRFAETFRQFDNSDSCWAAFHWSNGAPRLMVRRALASMQVPDNIRGFILIGSLANAHELADWIVFAPRPFDSDTGNDLWLGDPSTREEGLGELEQVDSSCGVRAVHVRVPWKDRRVDFLRRDGSRRILPFNISLHPDPVGAEYPGRG